MKFKYNKDNVAKLLEMYVKILEKTDDDEIEEAEETFATKVAEMVKSKEISDQDVLQLQNEKVAFSVIMTIGDHIRTNETSKLTYAEAMDLGRKYHFMLLTGVEKEFSDDKEKTFETFGKYEKMIDTIYEGDLSDDKLSLLRGLPTFKQWDKEVGYDVYKKYITL